MVGKKKMKSIHVEIPSDIISEIFSWLPVKSLFCFRSVSRFYNNLVSDESFVDIHQSRSTCHLDMRKFLAHSKENLYTIKLKVKHRKASPLRIEELDGISYDRVTYAKGLLCLWSRKVQQPPVIYNPTTRKKTSLPFPNHVDKGTLYNYSIGFDSDKKKYKILMITMRSKNVPMRFSIFTLGSSESWREIKYATQPLWLFLLFLNDGVCIDGVMYFSCPYDHEILTFNVRTENFRTISLWGDKVQSRNLIELAGKCAAIDYSRLYEKKIDLWILERSEEWVKHITISLPRAVSSGFNYFGSHSFTSTPHGEIVLIAKISSFKPKRIYFYDLKKKSWRLGIQVTKLEEKPEIIGIYSHVDCLLSCIYC